MFNSIDTKNAILVVLTDESKGFSTEAHTFFSKKEIGQHS